MSMAVVSVTIIANGVFPPISMFSFPSMKALKPPRFTTQPDMARPQIEIDTTDQTDVFVTVPDVIVRNLNYHRLWFYHHGRWSRHNYGCKGHLPVRFNDATRHERQGQSHNAGNARRKAVFFHMIIFMMLKKVWICNPQLKPSRECAAV
jgi:hypothetical protein